MSQSIQKSDPERGVEFIPFGSADKIKLSVKIIQNMVAVPTKSGRTCSERDALRFLMLCQAQRLNPFAGDAYLTGYDSKDGNPTFSLITSHGALLKRAEASPEYEGMESGIIVLSGDDSPVDREGDFHLPNETIAGGWARVYRKGRKPTYKRLAMEQRRPNYETQFWKGNKASEQIVKCAEADALRTTFPTLIGGLYTQEESGARADRMVADIVTAGKSFEAPSRLVESVQARLPATSTETQNAEQGEDTDLGPQSAAPTASLTKQTAGEELAALLESNGFTFQQLCAWGQDTGNIPDASSLPDIGAIPEETCKRLLRAKSGLIKGLKEVRGAQ